jgi:hypothetical protein
MKNNFFEKVSINLSWDKFLKKSVDENTDKILLKVSHFTKNQNTVGLIVGKVQSGKTSNIIGLTAKAFDRDYNLVIILFSDQKSLFSQNYERVSDAFTNLSSEVKVVNFSDDGDYKFLRKSQYDSFYEQGKKIVICSMKHKKYTNEITSMLRDTKFTQNIPIIIDDEGDDITQNNDRKKFEIIDDTMPRSPNNNAVVNLKGLFPISCYLTVTATPQAPLMLQSFQDLAIDFVNTIEPGPGYMGLEDFHSGEDKKLCSVIEDYSTLKEKYSLPDSFIESFLFYLIGAELRIDEKKDKHSMIVHSTKKLIEQNQIIHKIEILLDHFHSIELSTDILNNSKTKDYYRIFVEMYNKEKEFIEINDDSFNLFKRIIKKSKEVSLIQLNSKSDLKNLKKHTKNLNYFIVVGGDMLDRGLTIDGLAVNYFTREPQKGQIDTMLQRARWFGYKTEYRKYCRVYLTKHVANMFSSIIESEDDLWTQLRIIENTNLRVKDIDINIYVPNGNLIPTSPSKVDLEKKSLKPWFVQKYFSIHPEHQILNINLINSILKSKSKFDYNFKQHQKYNISASEIIEKLNDFKFSDSEENVRDFIKLSLNQLKIDQNELIDVLDMRYISGEERSLISNDEIGKKYLNNLMQGRNEEYPGDRNIIEDRFMLQIHRVKLKESYNKYNEGDIVIAFAFGIPEKYLKENFFRKAKIDLPTKSLP